MYQPTTIKDEALKVLEALPANASWEDVQYHLYVRQKIDLGLEDVRAGRVVSLEEAEQRMRQWTEQ